MHEHLPEMLAVARGERPADLVLRGAQVVNVYSGELEREPVAVHRGRIVGLGEYAANEVVDLPGGYLTPGLIDAHIHIESSMLSPAEFARCAVSRGTTAVAADPHELANVLGAAAVRWLLEAFRALPLRLWLNVPSCVPASPFDETGISLDAEAIADLLSEPGAVGLAEMMNYPGAALGVPEVLAKLQAAANRPIDGHAPGLRGLLLNAYLLAGPESDHECQTAAEALEKVSRGCYVFLRQGSAARNLEQLLPAVTDSNSRRFCLCCDDISPEELDEHGHIDRIIRAAIAGGVAPITALQMATVNAAERFGLSGSYGAIAPRRWADLCWTPSLTDFRAARVWLAGRQVAADGACLVDCPPTNMEALRGTMRLAACSPATFALPDPPDDVRAICVAPDTLLTTERRVSAPREGGVLAADTARDLCLLASMERRRGLPHVGLGLIHGLGLKRGAIATSVGHDAHHLTVAGVDRVSMAAAASELQRHGGGLVVAVGERAQAVLPLPLAGLMSDQGVSRVAHSHAVVRQAAADLGSKLPDPFMTLSFVGLTVIPALRLTPQGLVDSQRFERVPLAADQP